MTYSKRGIAVMALHLSIVLSMAAKYGFDRARLPRVWVRTASFDPNLPIRGRYVSLLLTVDAEKTGSPSDVGIHWIKLRVDHDRLLAVPAPSPSGGLSVTLRGATQWVLSPSVEFYLPEHAQDPTRLQPGEELWAEVSVPEDGSPRPIRLGKKKDGVLKPLDLR